MIKTKNIGDMRKEIDRKLTELVELANNLALEETKLGKTGSVEDFKTQKRTGANSAGDGEGKTTITINTKLKGKEDI